MEISHSAIPRTSPRFVASCIAMGGPLRGVPGGFYHLWDIRRISNTSVPELEQKYREINKSNTF